jgi:flagellar basal-body rod protein FlgB
MPTLNPATIEQISAALSVTHLRHQTIASNIANRDAQGYQRLAVSFNEALNAAGEQPRASIVSETTDPTAAPPSLEEDMVALSSNAMNYQALVKALSRYLSIQQTIASGGTKG